MKTEPACQQNLLLIATGEFAYLLLRPRRLDAKPSDELINDLSLLLTRDNAIACKGRQGGKSKIFAYREIRDDAIHFTVFGTEANPHADRISRRVKMHLLSFDAHLPVLYRVSTENCTCYLTPAGAKQTGESDNFARVYIDVRPLQYTPTSQLASLQEHFLLNVVLPNFKACLTMLAHFPQLLAQHLSDQFYFRQTLHLAYIYCPAIAHNCHAITDRIEFVKAMTDENYGDAVNLQLTNDREKGADFSLVERRGRLIHDHELALKRNSTSNG